MRPECVECMLCLIPLLPLLGFVVNSLFGRRMGKGFVAAIGCGMPLASFVLSAMALWALRERGGALEQTLFDWIVTGSLNVGFSLRVDALSAVMILIVTGVGSLIHIYSIGYMAHDKGFARYFAYLNLFMFAMLVLVTADNLLLMFVGWEGVGLCSYLLIGFWYEDINNAEAGKKAFIVNRIGDFGFILGMFFLYSAYGTLHFSGFNTPVGDLTLPALLLFVGACGKSAQIPLYVWLPDAMAGPTPVSALIHAATMVTAGVYMLARLHVVFASVPFVMDVVGLIAAGTALFAAVIAVAQTDIKKVLAYSTISQLGYMFIAMASTAFAAGIFHLMTHAFFKALLFMSAGAVIHALAGEQNILKMGGLWRKTPFIGVVFIIGSLALAGVPPFAGFFSKDQILIGAYQTWHAGGGPLWLAIWISAVVTAFLTAFYIFRLISLTFFGKYAGDEAKLHHLHQPDWSMSFGLGVLALLSIGGGWIGGGLETFLQGTWGGAHGAGGHDGHDLNVAVSIACAVGGVALALLLYGKCRERMLGIGGGNGGMAFLHKVVANKFYIDELYSVVIVTPLKLIAFGAWAVIDRFLIDALLVNGAATLAAWLGGRVRLVQTGVTNTSALMMAIGVVVVLCYMIFVIF